MSFYQKKERNFKIETHSGKKLKISKIGSFTNTEEDNLVSPKARKGTQRGKMLSIIRRDKVAEVCA